MSIIISVKKVQEKEEKTEFNLEKNSLNQLIEAFLSLKMMWISFFLFLHHANIPTIVTLFKMIALKLHPNLVWNLKRIWKDLITAKQSTVTKKKQNLLLQRK